MSSDVHEFNAHSAEHSTSVTMQRKAENGAPKDEENLAKKVKLPVSKLQKKHKTKLMSSSVSKSKKKPKRLKKSKTEEDEYVFSYCSYARVDH